VHSHPIPILQFTSLFRIAFALNLLPGKAPYMRARPAPVQDILLVLDLDILLPSFDYRPVRIGPSQAFVQIRMVRLILQFSRNLEGGRLGSGTSVRAKEVAESAVGISQLCLRVDKFEPLIAKGRCL